MEEAAELKKRKDSMKRKLRKEDLGYAGMRRQGRSTRKIRRQGNGRRMEPLKRNGRNSKESYKGL